MYSYNLHAKVNECLREFPCIISERPVGMFKIMRNNRAEIRDLNACGECSGNLLENTYRFLFVIKLLSRLLLIHAIQKESKI